MSHFIVVPVANTNDRCKGWLDDLLTSLRAGGYYKKDYRVLLCYDNCSMEFQQYFFDKYQGDMIAALNNQNPENLNFCKNVNTGLRQAFAMDAKHFTVLNMDTVLPKESVFKHVAGEGLSFPTPVGDIKDLQKTKPKDLTRTPVLKYSGFCMSFPRKLVETIGVLDERFVAGFEDDEISARAGLAGFPVEVVNINVFHDQSHRDEHPSSTGAYSMADLGVGLGIYRRKWSIPAGMAHEDFNKWILENHTFRPELVCL